MSLISNLEITGEKNSALCFSVADGDIQLVRRENLDGSGFFSYTSEEVKFTVCIKEKPMVDVSASLNDKIIYTKYDNYDETLVTVNDHINAINKLLKRGVWIIPDLGFNNGVLAIKDRALILPKYEKLSPYEDFAYAYTLDGNTKVTLNNNIMTIYTDTGITLLSLDVTSSSFLEILNAYKGRVFIADDTLKPSVKLSSLQIINSLGEAVLYDEDTSSIQVTPDSKISFNTDDEKTILYNCKKVEYPVTTEINFPKLLQSRTELLREPNIKKIMFYLNKAIGGHIRKDKYES